MSGRLPEATYRALEGTTFTLSPLEGDAWSISLVLASVSPLGTRTMGDGDELDCYSLVFAQTEGSAHAPQGTYRVTHEELGTQVIFIVPLGPATGALMRYQAIFN